VTSAGCRERAVCDPVGLITELVAAPEPRLAAEQIRGIATAVAGGRAKSRRLASALAGRPAVLADGRSPAPRVVGDLLVALREAGARSVSPPRCARCGKQLTTFQRNGQDWYCSACGQQGAEPVPCAAGPDLLDLRPGHSVRHLLHNRAPVVPGLPAPDAACSACGRLAAIASGTLADPLCAGCTGPARWAGCPVCSDPGHPNPGQCARCLVNRRLDELMGPFAGALPPGLQALRRDIATAEHPGTAMRWPMSKPSTAKKPAD
jgi:hypothetical protein